MTKHIQTIRTLTAALICLLATESQAAVSQIDRIVALVNEDIITSTELDQETQRILIPLQQQNTQLPPMATIKRQVLDRLVLKKLQLAAASQAGINITEDVLAQAIHDIARKNGLTLSQFRETLREQGLSFNSFREDIRTQITLAHLQEQEIRNKIRVSEQEIDTYITQHNSSSAAETLYYLQHILVATPEGAAPDEIQTAKAKAEKVVAELRAGADFKSKALSVSDGSRALEGGDLGWRAGNQLPTIFAAPIQAMNTGEISDPIASPSGFHIVRLNDRKGGERHIITQTKVRHIVIQTDELTSDRDASTRLEQLRTRIKSGEDFSALARSHSDDTSSALKGGDLGWTTPGDLLAQFDNAISQLSPGEMSKPFRTDMGWHLAQVLERRNFDNTSAVERASARAAIIKRKMSEESELYLRRLRDEAYIDIRLDDV